MAEEARWRQGKKKKEKKVGTKMRKNIVVHLIKNYIVSLYKFWT